MQMHLMSLTYMVAQASQEYSQENKSIVLVPVCHNSFNGNNDITNKGNRF